MYTGGSQLAKMYGKMRVYREWASDYEERVKKGELSTENRDEFLKRRAIKLDVTKKEAKDAGVYWPHWPQEDSK
jgi:hypothetical protein